MEKSSFLFSAFRQTKTFECSIGLESKSTVHIKLVVDCEESQKYKVESRKISNQ